ncbi:MULTISPECIES: hypothetical protein [unclassified Variovorax]|jgi:hypothetical protein|uniref:hypothetical protein n=1 Tax=unclassified Variovorax TaxID=663243 RepID=UPI001601E432|nr:MULTISPECIES: hypothetical protein [unclassified Variovorax]MBB1602663.1 hypothetical protein [Variovorax sp. UMC13]MDM0086079.1 hypothetical protein [Variovorax sp. J22G40]MDM0145664.1 hypothetical protein [Variovorax sp. J2P1-31]
MQPVLEFIQRHERSYTYSIRAPRHGGPVPPACYVDRGLSSLSACVFDAAQALSVNFPKVYIRYQGLCMGEMDVSRLATCADLVAAELMAEYGRREVPESAVLDAAVVRLRERLDATALAV